jgi:hypothetical protein
MKPSSDEGFILSVFSKEVARSPAKAKLKKNDTWSATEFAVRFNRLPQP